VVALVLGAEPGADVFEAGEAFVVGGGIGPAGRWFWGWWVGVGMVGVVLSPVVVEGAVELAVVLAGGAASGPGVDVVALAALGWFVAAGEAAVAVADLEGAAEGAGEPAACPMLMIRSGPSKMMRSMSAWSSRGATVPGVRTVPSASSQTRPVKVS
jgi:hypothetical protein